MSQISRLAGNFANSRDKAHAFNESLIVKDQDDLIPINYLDTLYMYFLIIFLYYFWK